MKVDVIIFIEHVPRELYISELIKNKLQQRGLKVVIASMSYHKHKVLLNYKTKSIITPFIGFGKNSICDIYYKIYGDDILYFNLNYEQFLFPFTGKFKLPKTKTAKQNQINFCWGDHFKKYLNEGGVIKKNLVVSGRPYSEAILMQKDKSYQIKKDICLKYNLEIKKKIVFVALTDSLAFYSEEKIKKIVAFGGSLEGLLIQKDHDQKTINKLIQVFKHLEKDPRFLQYQFIFKPHPTVSIKMYKQLFKQNNFSLPENILLVQGEDPIKILLSSDYLLTNYSTLIVDALTIDKTVLCFNHDKTLDYLWWAEFSDEFINTPDELISSLEKTFNKNKNISEYYIQSSMGITNISNEISKRIKTKKNELFDKFVVWRIFKFSNLILKSFIKSILFVTAKKLNHSFAKDEDHFNLAEVNKTI
jgi:surface carbohydrate biosynthesis protein